MRYDPIEFDNQVNNRQLKEKIFIIASNLKKNGIFKRKREFLKELKFSNFGNDW